ncbi:MAG: hypothetical protein EXS18_07495 [Verrucomicrobiae bacterium]|nr:hypothetical protein [Verrucomicrobiae bacterium]
MGVNGRGGTIGFSNKEFMNSALGKATVKTLNAIINQVSTTQLPESGRRMSKATTTAKTDSEAKAQSEAMKSTPGKVLAVPTKGLLIVTLGSKQGFKNGDKLKLYETVDTKDDKGNVVFTEEKLVGEITLDAVQEEKSKASYTGSADVKAGWVVKAN